MKWLVAILALVFLLRLPSLFEPHWYGDEEIYLVLGQMMRRGAVLYRDIWDNKTPLLYLIYSISPTLLWAKFTAMVAVLGTTAGTYFLSKKLFADKSNAYALVATALVGILLSVPVLEGTIANAELYFTLPIVLGAILVYRLLTTGYQLRAAIWTGVLMATAFLLKVPAVFDFAGFFGAYFVIKLVDEFLSPTKNFQRFVKQQGKVFLPIFIAFTTPVALIALYFFANHALPDFITAAFSQNANYIAVGSGSFSKLANPLFIKGLLLLVGMAAITIAYAKKYLSQELVLLTLWFGFSLYGALLSNREYMHYLLQIVPPVVLLGAYLISHINRYSSLAVAYFASLLVIAKMFFGAFALNPITYYQNFFDFISERKLWKDYINFFDGRTAGYYAVANSIKNNSSPNEPIFVWGDVASIYTLSARPAATKFIQAHHLTTIDQRNYDLTMSRLLKYQPKYIVVTRPVQFPFPALETFLQRNYKLVGTSEGTYIYANNFSTSPAPWTPNYY